MKNLVYIVLLLMAHMGVAQTVVDIENFESNTGLGIPGGSFSWCSQSTTCGSNDIFDVTNADPANAFKVLNCVTGEVGSIFARIDDECNSGNNQYFEVTLNNPPGNNGLLRFEGSFASIGDGLDISDYFTLEYNLNGVGFVLATTFSQNNNASFMNTEGDVFNSTFTTYGFDLGYGLGGSNLVLRINFIGFTGTSEGAGFDEFKLLHTAGCTPPATQASDISLSLTGLSTYNVNWTNGSGDRTLVTARLKSTSAGDPVNGNDYSGVANGSFGTAGTETYAGSQNFVVYDGTGSTCTVTGLSSSDLYTFSVYSYNSADNCYNLDELFASPCYVDDNQNTNDIYTASSIAGNNTNSGTASSPYASISYAVSIASEGDMIFVDAGNYVGLDSQIDLTIDNISFIGAGYDQTIIDNNYGGTSTDYFMYVDANNITFKDMSFTGYENQGTQTPGHSGQAITIGGGSTPISGILLENVSFYLNGMSGGNPALVILSDAQVDIRGGGSYCNSPGTAYTGGVEVFGENTTVNIDNYVIAYNYSTLFPGAGLRITGGDDTYVNVSNSVISNNHANEGAGIAQWNGNLTMTDCIIEDNIDANGSVHYGAGYRISAGTAVFTNCIFSNNQGDTDCRGSAVSARYHGSTSAYATSYSSNKSINVQLNSCVFDGNTPTADGADIYGANGYGESCVITAQDCQFLSNVNYNLVSDGSSPVSGLNVTYFGSTPTSTGSNITKVLSGNALFTPDPSVPGYTGSCATQIILPVELSAFEGKCTDKGNELMWQTTSEYNNAFFIVERAGVDGQFELITKTPGSLNSSDLLTYYFTDEHPKTGLNYYRLSQVDVDGRSESFEPILVNNNCATDELLLSFSERTNELIFSDEQVGVTSITLITASGKIIEEISVDAHEHFDHLSLHNPPESGVYLVRIHKKESVLTGRILITK